jgi:hypothetical protein
MTGISLHMQWPLTSQNKNDCFFAAIVTDERQHKFSDTSVLKESDGDAGDAGEQQRRREDRLPAPPVHDERAEHERGDLDQRRQDRRHKLEAQFECLCTQVDAMITIFCDFCQFSANKLAFFSKTNVIITNVICKN